MTYASEVLADSPLFALAFDEASGTTAEDASSNNRDGAYTAAGITYQATGPSAGIPYAITTNGSTGYATGPSIGGSLGSTQAQSWEIIFYTGSSISSASGATWLVGSSVNNRWIAALGSATGSLTNEVISIGDGDSTRRTGWSGITIAAGWHHLVLTYSGSQNGWLAYLDGQEVVADLGGTKIANSSGAFGQSGTVIPRVGGHFTSSNQFSAVTAAWLACYDSTLSSARVAAHYAAVSGIFLALTPATVTVTPQSLLAPINLLLSPATITVTAQPMGLPISVALSPATITVTPSPLGIGAISVALSPATVTVTPQALDVARSVPLTPAVITVTAVNLTAAFLGVPPETKGMSLITASGYATNPFSATRTADRYRVVPASPVYSGRATGLVHVYPPEPA